jgi:hypothetical protein
LAKKGRAETQTDIFKSKLGNLIESKTIVDGQTRGKTNAKDHKPSTGSILSAFKNSFLKKLKFSDKVYPHPTPK